MQLEIWIFLFAISTLVIYMLWWDKPFSVRSHIIVPRSYPHCSKIQNDEVLKYQPSTTKQYDSPQAGEFGLNMAPKIGWWPYLQGKFHVPACHTHLFLFFFIAL
ncbi:hypothetical protein BJ165DRAFT_649317 [Panaeolus papilionaceus]|nr:hypothetical protein BJ165DRAFT_649317 [Panaeolus papilionaceus]